MRGIEFITGHMDYNPAYTYILQTKATYAVLSVGLWNFFNGRSKLVRFKMAPINALTEGQIKP